MKKSVGGPSLNRYARLIDRIFFSHYKEGMREIEFDRDELVQAAKRLKIKLPKNLGDVIYSFRYRTSLPPSVLEKAPAGANWIIRSAGRSRYRIVASRRSVLAPNEMLADTKIPDATPGVIAMYALSDEQALLARVRYNRLIDIFTGVACYPLQSHLRTSVPNVGQVETDEIYIGVDRRGAHFVFPVQAKGGKDRLNVVQIEQDFSLCASKFPSLICRPMGAQFIESDLIALFEFSKQKGEVALVSEKHYRLVPPDELTEKDLEDYRNQPV